MRGWSRYEQKLTLTSERAKAGVGAWQDQEQEQEQGRRRWAGEGQEHSILILLVFCQYQPPCNFPWGGAEQVRAGAGGSRVRVGAGEEQRRSWEKSRSSAGAAREQGRNNMNIGRWVSVCSGSLLVAY